MTKPQTEIVPGAAFHNGAFEPTLANGDDLLAIIQLRVSDSCSPEL